MIPLQKWPKGINMVVIDLCDVIRYDLTLKIAWSLARLHEELGKIQKSGLEPIPLLNFSTGHDTWSGNYAQIGSTDTYYTVCRNLIEEVIDIFNLPRSPLLGVDEENAQNQFAVNLDHIIVRQKDLLWGDFYFLIDEVFKNSSCTWVSLIIIEIFYSFCKKYAKISRSE